MGKIKRQELFAHKQRQIRDDFIDVLARTGNKAAQDYINPSIFSESHMLDAARYAMSNFGTPDTLIMSPQALEDFKKLIK